MDNSDYNPQVLEAHINYDAEPVYKRVVLLHEKQCGDTGVRTALEVIWKSEVCEAYVRLSTAYENKILMSVGLSEAEILALPPNVLNDLADAVGKLKNNGPDALPVVEYKMWARQNPRKDSPFYLPADITAGGKLPYYLTKNRVTGLYDLDKKHSYYYQIQGEMMCSQRDYAVLAVYHKRTAGDRIYLSCVPYDFTFCKHMTKQLSDFYSCFNTTE